MKRVLFLLLGLIFICMSASIYGQASAYDFVNSTGSYTAITGGTVLGTASVGGTGALALDSNNYTLDDGTIPFTFLFNGLGYTGLNVNCNGYITFGTVLPSGTAYSPISSSTGYDGTISAVGGNLMGRNTSGSLGEIRYETVGSAPNREFVIQYANFRRQASSYTGDYMNFQIRIAETTNAINIVYNAFTVASTTSSTVQVGLRGASNSDYNNRYTTSNWASTTAGTSNSKSCTIKNTIKPTAGLTFTWTLPTVPPNIAVLVSPADGSGSVYTNASINWASGGYFPTGYKLFFGTDTPPTNIINGTDLGDVTSYTPTLDPLTLYYWRIQPYNDYGDQTGGTIWSFTTAGSPISGTYTIGSGGDYTTLTDAINALNGVGASAAGVTFNVLAGSVFAENPPAIIASGSETGSIIFQKSGAGANPIINPTGTAAGDEFGIKLDTADYVTFDGIDIANYSGTDIEYGYWIAGSSTDGCNHNVIKNCTVELSNTNTGTKGIYLQSAAGSELTANTYNELYNNTISNAYNGIYITGSSTSGWEDQYNEIEANTISNCSVNNVYLTYQKYFALHGSSITLIAGVTNTVYGVNIDGSTSTGEIYNNTIAGSESQTSTGLVYGIYLNSVGNVVIYDNTLSDYIAGSSAYGIYLGQGTSSAYSNTINGLTGANSVYGIYTFACTAADIYSNVVYDLESISVTTGKAYGIYLSGTAFNTYNNMISNLRNPDGTAAIQIYGIYVSSGINYVYYNSILLDAIGNDASFTTAALYASTAATQIYMNNNIFVNNSMPGSSGKSVAFYRSSTGFSNINTTSANNMYYAGASDAQHLIFFDGTNGYSILADYKTAADPRDAISFSENAPFISNINLHINTGTPTIVESSGIAISGITTDIDGNTRNAETPDIGADEGTFTTMEGAPGQAVMLSPDNEAINVNPLTVTLDWDIPLSGGTPTGYAVFLSDNYADLLAQTYDYYSELEADVTEFTPINSSITLSYNTIWYWMVVPFNESGYPAIGDSLIWSFTTIRAPLTGTKTINPLGSGENNYATFTQALNDIVLLGLGTGGVVFEVKDGIEFIEEIPSITFTGTASNPIVFRRDNTSLTRPAIKPTTSVAGIQLVGSDYITFDGIDIIVNSGSAVNYGFSLIPSSTSNGAQYNEIKNCSIILNKENTGTKGIYQNFNALTPVNSSGANSHNKFSNVTIENSVMGFYLNGSTSTSYPDTGIEISACTIGGTSLNDMGGNSHGYGIYASYEKNLTICNSEIRNFDVVGNSFNYGIYTYYTQGALNIYNNKIHNLQGSSITSGNYGQYGMYIHLLETDAPAVAKIYNNMIWDITSAYSGVQVNNTIVCGIYLSVFGANVFNVDFNSIKIAGPLNANSACFYYNSATTGIIKARNNVFANITPAQSGSCLHFCLYSPLAGSIGSIGSISDYNVLYIQNISNGYIGKSGSVIYSTLASWIAGMNADYHSNSVNPSFENNDAHIQTDVFTSVESRGNYFSGSDLIDWVQFDIDGNLRNVSTPDIGADEGDFIGKPAAPVVVISRNQDENIILSWTLDPIVTTYNIYGSGDASSSEAWTLLGTVSNNSYTVSLENDEFMFYRVIAIAP